LARPTEAAAGQEDRARDHEESQPAPACDGGQLVTGSGALLMRMASEAPPPEKGAADQGPATCFHAKGAPRVGIAYYLSRIRQHIPCSDACFVIALVYIDRAAKRDPLMAVCDLTCHRLVLTGIMLATRYHDDEEDMHYNNAYFAKVGGLGATELGGLERRFLELLGWRLYVSPAEYDRYVKLVCSAAP